MALAKILREPRGKMNCLMESFFQGLIDNGRLVAYTVEIDKASERETKDRRVIVIKKGATLTPTKKLRYHQPVFVEDASTKARYNLSIRAEGGMFDDEGENTVYHSCVLEKLVSASDGFDAREVAKDYYGGVAIPENMVVARLRMNYAQGGDSYGEFVVEGEMDGLFKEICDFIRGT